MTANDNDMRRVWIALGGNAHIYIQPGPDGASETLCRLTPITGGYSAAFPALDRPDKAFSDLITAKAWAEWRLQPWYRRVF